MPFLKGRRDKKPEDNTLNSFNIQKADLNVILQLICHRNPERTFNIRGYYFPICSRCMGLYLGALLGFIYLNQVYIFYTFNYIIISVLMIIPTFIDGITQLFGFRESNNTLRFFKE